ncbi:MAG: Chaperone protein HtpG [Chlamydiae bacterium]|nr:Chaperone protein HtpG [Chlamydiota bacterium]
MSTGQLNIQAENILPIIKRWLYTEKDIFVRELVSNACDAMKKLEMLAQDGKCEIDPSTFKIEIKIDKENNTLQIIDNGIGMTKDEIQKYIANIAFSGAEEFMKKYASKKEEDQIIGHFGLGFYSAYMVAKNVSIDSLSYKKKSKAALWTCDGSVDYILDLGKRKERGTTITLYLEDKAKEYLDETKLIRILKQYCLFLPYPLYLNETHINEKAPLWLKPKNKIKQEEYLDFYKQLYPMEQDPILWVHLNVDFPFHLKGILYFPKLKKDFEYNKNTLKLFCNRVFVSDNCKDLLPDFLMILKGAIDSPDIPLNVSRSYLQMDSQVRQISGHISKKIADELTKLYKKDHQRFTDNWKDFELILKMGAMQDDKFFKRTKELFIWKTTHDKWVSLSELEAQETIYYTSEETNHDLIELYKEKEIDVLLAHPFLDPHFFGFLEKNTKLKFKRIDSELDDKLIDSEKEDTLLDDKGHTLGAKIEKLITKTLDEKELTVQAKSLAKDEILGFVQIEEGSRRFRDMMQYSNPDMPAFPQPKTFIVNTNHALIKNLLNFDTKNASLTKELVQVLYEQCLLNQKELDPKAFSNFLTKTQTLISELCQKLV